MESQKEHSLMTANDPKRTFSMFININILYFAFFALIISGCGSFDRIDSQNEQGARIRFSTSLVVEHGTHQKAAEIFLKKEKYKDICPYGIFGIYPGPLMEGGTTSVIVRCKNQQGREYTVWD